MRKTKGEEEEKYEKSRKRIERERERAHTHTHTVSRQGSGVHGDAYIYRVYFEGAGVRADVPLMSVLECNETRANTFTQVRHVTLLCSRATRRSPPSLRGRHVTHLDSHACLSTWDAVTLTS